MTQVKEMSNQQLNRALAVALGCQVEEHSGTVFFFTVLPNGNRLYHQLPDYAGDPAASLEVQTAAIAKDKTAYIKNLMYVCWRGDRMEYCNLDDDEWVLLSAISDLLTAKPRERAEAAYMTLSQVSGQ